MPGLSYLSHFTMNKQKCLICLSIKLEVCRAAEILSMACPTENVQFTHPWTSTV